jgi:hypothetical protein
VRSRTYLRHSPGSKPPGVKPHLKPWRTDIDGQLAKDYAAELKRLGMTQRAGTERLMRSFLGLDPDVRAMLLQILTPERTALLAKRILREMGGGR